MNTKPVSANPQGSKTEPAFNELLGALSQLMNYFEVHTIDTGRTKRGEEVFRLAQRAVARGQSMLDEYGSFHCEECGGWRESFIGLIRKMPANERAILCAELAQIPTIKERLSDRDKSQANLILKATSEQ